MADIGKIIKEVTFEPIDQPSSMPEPAQPTPAAPVKEPVPAQRQEPSIWTALHYL